MKIISKILHIIFSRARFDFGQSRKLCNNFSRTNTVNAAIKWVHFDHQRWSETIMYLLIEIFIHPSVCVCVSKPHATFGLINRQRTFVKVEEFLWNYHILLILSNVTRLWFISGFRLRFCIWLQRLIYARIHSSQPNCNAKQQNSRRLPPERRKRMK